MEKFRELLTSNVWKKQKTCDNFWKDLPDEVTNYKEHVLLKVSEH